jgi:hypothetical protein
MTCARAGCTAQRTASARSAARCIDGAFVADEHSGIMVVMAECCTTSITHVVHTHVTHLHGDRAQVLVEQADVSEMFQRLCLLLCAHHRRWTEVSENNLRQ